MGDRPPPPVFSGSAFSSKFSFPPRSLSPCNVLWWGSDPPPRNQLAFLSIPACHCTRKQENMHPAALQLCACPGAYLLHRGTTAHGTSLPALLHAPWLPPCGAWWEPEWTKNTLVKVFLKHTQCYLTLSCVCYLLLQNFISYSHTVFHIITHIIILFVLFVLHYHYFICIFF